MHMCGSENLMDEMTPFPSDQGTSPKPVQEEEAEAVRYSPPPQLDSTVLSRTSGAASHAACRGAQCEASKVSTA
jgi:hypothetical protein